MTMKTRSAAACVVRAAAMATMMLSTVALAQNAGNPFKTKDAADKFSQSNTTCGAYAAFVFHCDKKHSEVMEKVGKEFINRAYLSGMMAGLSEQTLSKRFDTSSRQISALTNNSCDNLDVLFEKHGDFCEAFFKAGPWSNALTAQPK
jgi:hypothetical protein